VWRGGVLLVLEFRRREGKNQGRVTTASQFAMQGGEFSQWELEVAGEKRETEGGGGRILGNAICQKP